MTNLDSVLKSRDITLLTKVHKVKGFSSSHVWMWDLDYKEGQLLKNSYFWTVVLEKTLESPLDVKEIKLVNPKGNQPWIFIGRTGAEAEALILWPFDVKSWLTGKDYDAGKDCGRENGLTEDEMVGWHHWLEGHEFEQALGDSEGQEAWCAVVYGITKSQTQLSDWTTTLLILSKFIIFLKFTFSFGFTGS